MEKSQVPTEHLFNVHEWYNLEWYHAKCLTEHTLSFQQNRGNTTEDGIKFCQPCAEDNIDIDTNNDGDISLN